jgi:hypothetical protein
VANKRPIGGARLLQSHAKAARQTDFFDETLTRLLAQWGQRCRIGVGALDSRRISPRW